MVFATVNLLTLGAAYLTLSNALTQRLETSLTEEFRSLDIAATPRALAALVSAKARAADPAHTVFAFRGSDGRMAGNATAVLENDGLYLRAASPDLPLSEDGYIQRIERLSGGVLVVAESLTPVAEMRRTFLSVLAFSLAPTLALSLGLALLIARNSARRVSRIETTLNRLAGGDLSARVQAGGDGDDLDRIARGLDRMADKQQAAIEAMRQVSADIAHDLRTPLQRISVLLDDLGRALPDDGPVAELAQRANAEADRAGAVFRALLQIAQIEGGPPAQGFRPVDLSQTAHALADLYGPVAEDAGRRLVLDLPDGPLVIRGDPNLVSQALSNLLENALNHAPGGDISLSAARLPQGIAVTIADRGPGIPPEERPHVTRRLYRLDRSRTTPGHGLGLSLVAAIAEAHRARLELDDNAPGLRASIVFSPGTPSAEG